MTGAAETAVMRIAFLAEETRRDHRVRFECDIGKPKGVTRRSLCRSFFPIVAQRARHLHAEQTNTSTGRASPEGRVNPPHARGSAGTPRPTPYTSPNLRREHLAQDI